MSPNTTTRATAKAGALQAGQPIAGGENLIDLLAFDSVAAGIKVGDALRERLATAERAMGAHAGTFEDAQLAGDAAERQHADEAYRLQREVNRLGLAITRADARLAEVAAAERQADARAQLKAASKAAARAEAIVATDYPATARAVAALLEELGQLQGEVIAARRAARDAGLDDEADALVLPHERRARREIAEDVEVLSETPRVGVFDADGRAVGSSTGTGRYWGTDAHQAPAAPTRRIERRIVQERFTALDLAAATVLLPDPETEHGTIVRQGGDRN